MAQAPVHRLIQTCMTVGTPDVRKRITSCSTETVYNHTESAAAVAD